MVGPVHHCNPEDPCPVLVGPECYGKDWRNVEIDWFKPLTPKEIAYLDDECQRAKYWKRNTFTLG